MSYLPARFHQLALTALVAQIPFELRYSWYGLSNLQWTFVLTALLAVPLLIENWRALLHDRLILAGALFVATQWLGAMLAPDFQANAYKAAARFSAGLALLAIVRVYRDRDFLFRTWGIAAGLAAVYALTEYAGLGFPELFRDEEFFAGEIQRLSGSFEYPNTAAAYFALSLPIVWSSPRILGKWPTTILLWTALTFTLSRGAMVAVIAAGLLAWILLRFGRSESKAYGVFLGVGVAIYLLLTPAIPYVSERILGLALGNPLAAVYSTPWNRLVQQPNASDAVPLQIRSTDSSRWPSTGASRVAVSYRWWNTETETFIQEAEPPLVSLLPREVSPGETVDVAAAIRTPGQPGNYILVLELFSRDFYWFSRTGLKPALLQVEIGPGVQRSTGETDLSTYYNWEKTREERGGKPLGESLTAALPRQALWRAAIVMFTEHPLGVGPDNFRLRYGPYLGATNWNTRVHSNNLYLELLTGSGVLGFAAFVLMIAVRRWSPGAPSVALAVFLIHGLVDTFLMATPVYFAFWIVLGFDGGGLPKGEESPGAGGGVR